ncbi:MAG TPA: MBL fold metallo-hydrolase [Patescibacteria group bacterium]|nr:MBL fold metallo-hydrolase [Patescibacteria group bacterium]
MQIFWHGFSCVRIEAAHGDKEATLVTDPYSSDSGLRFPRTLAPEVVALSDQNQKKFPLDVFTNKPFVIADPGEYEVSGIFSYAFAVPNEQKKYPHGLMYRFEIEGMSIGFLGGLNRKLTEEETGVLENIDILLIPVGGGGELNAKQAAEMIQVIEPRLVIPLNYQIDGVKEKLGSVDAFCKELGVKQRQDLNKLKISRKDLPADELVTVVLERA